MFFCLRSSAKYFHLPVLFFSLSKDQPDQYFSVFKGIKISVYSENARINVDTKVQWQPNAGDEYNIFSDFGFSQNTEDP